ncbi:SDR family NAD(P)-dependent oxidoreductase [Citricoccus sp. NPDC055426]|uniref:SDR family NAD(P)-dependent oxidoreductase n=1 Tax=Citricoccus sp. NPDC055426 TaxID=3155536 RepID=UPI0034239A36
MTKGRVAGKTAIVTGAGSGIGRGIAKRFAEEGATVVVADMAQDAADETVDLISQGGGQALAVRADVTQADDVAALVATATDAFGGVDILVNNAGISFGDTLKLHELEQYAWQKIMDVNLTGVFLCCKHVLPSLMERGGGAIVNIASAAAIGMAPRAAYAASKGGVVALTRSLAFQYGEQGIRVNAICPGPVETPMSNAVRASGMYDDDGIVDLSIKRRGTPEDIANAVLFLASDEARYVTSDVIPVDGGALRLRAERFRNR